VPAAIQSPLEGRPSNRPTNRHLAGAPLEKRLICDSTADPDVLALAAGLGRVLVSHDLKTMPGHFYRFLRRRESPGVILIPQFLSTGYAVEELRIAWLCQEAYEFRNRIIYLPL